MDNQQLQNKIKKWEEILRSLEHTRLPEALKRIGEAGAEGDLRENIAYEEAEMQVYRLQDKIDEVRRIISKLKNYSCVKSAGDMGDKK